MTGDLESALRISRPNQRGAKAALTPCVLHIFRMRNRTESRSIQWTHPLAAMITARRHTIPVSVPALRPGLIRPGSGAVGMIRMFRAESDIYAREAIGSTTPDGTQRPARLLRDTHPVQTMLAPPICLRTTGGIGSPYTEDPQTACESPREAMTDATNARVPGGEEGRKTQPGYCVGTCLPKNGVAVRCGDFAGATVVFGLLT